MIKEIVTVDLETEMDLILTNKRTMKLAELCGLSLTVQTALATAVSEIARCALSLGKHASLKLGIAVLSPAKKQIVALVCNTTEACGNAEAVNFARKLVDDVKLIKSDSTYNVQLNHDIKFSGLISDAKIELFTDYFRTELPLSPYDELRKKNIQLLEFSGKLKESENQYRSLSDTIPLMMFLANPAGEIIYINQWLKDYFGPSLTIIKPFLGTGLIHPEDEHGINIEWNAFFEAKKPFRSQGRLKHKDTGAYLWHLISIIPVKDEHDTVIQWTGFLVDIHAHKVVEDTLKDNAELQAAQKNLVDYQQRLEQKINELNTSNHELEQFAYIASHDLKEPLRKIVTFSSLLTEKVKTLDADTLMYFGKIISSSKRMTELINDVLDWSKISRTKEEFEAVDLNVIIRNVETDYELLIREKQAIIEIATLPVVNGSRLQMTQLFSNLISNALKFCETTPFIRIASRNVSAQEIETLRLNPACNYGEISISDNGIGFDQEYSEQIFKIFQRLNSQSEYSGTGIGLAICKKIVENHGGIISAAGGNGKGATFTIIIPIDYCEPPLQNNSRVHDTSLSQTAS